MIEKFQVNEFRSQYTVYFVKIKMYAQFNGLNRLQGMFWLGFCHQLEIYPPGVFVHVWFFDLHRLPGFNLRKYLLVKNYLLFKRFDYIDDVYSAACNQEE